MAAPASSGHRRAGFGAKARVSRNLRTARRNFKKGRRLLLSALPGGGQVLAMPGDAADQAKKREVVARKSAQWGAITLLVNNAGANPVRSVFDTTFEEYLKAFEINCLSTITHCTSSVLPAMLKSGCGTVVEYLFNSVYGRWASSNSAGYSVGKYAVAGYTDALRQALVGTPVHVLGVFPGFIQTDMTMPFVQPGTLKSHMGKTPDQIAKAILKAVDRLKSELYYPWYVPWVLRLHRWFPATSDYIARRVKR